MVYLDAASTAKYRNVDDIIVDTMVTAMKDCWMNPSSLYASNVKNKIEKCRANIAEFINAKPEEIYFTSGASESNNWCLQGFVKQHLSEGNRTCVITSTIEHKSILECTSNLDNVDVEYVGVDKDGIISIAQLRNLMFGKSILDDRFLVSIHFANNEIGTIQRIKDIAHEVHRFNGVLHVDATQALPNIPIDVEELGIDMLSASGHKISPVLRGIGFLYKRNGVNIKPLIYGAQENGMRGSTENTYGIIGLSKALEYCDFSYEAMREMRDKRDYFINQLESKFGCKLNGHRRCRLLNNINVTFSQNITGESLLYMLDLSGIAVSTGSACNSKSIEKSHVLDAIGLSDSDAIKTIRFTLPDDITYQEIDKVINEIDKCIKLIEMEN